MKSTILLCFICFIKAISLRILERPSSWSLKFGWEKKFDFMSSFLRTIFTAYGWFVVTSMHRLTVAVAPSPTDSFNRYLFTNFPRGFMNRRVVRACHCRLFGELELA